MYIRARARTHARTLKQTNNKKNIYYLILLLFIFNFYYNKCSKCFLFDSIHA